MALAWNVSARHAGGLPCSLAELEAPSTDLSGAGGGVESTEEACWWFGKILCKFWEEPVGGWKDGPSCTLRFCSEWEGFPQPESSLQISKQPLVDAPCLTSLKFSFWGFSDGSSSITQKVVPQMVIKRGLCVLFKGKFCLRQHYFGLLGQSGMRRASLLDGERLASVSEDVRAQE